MPTPLPLPMSFALLQTSHGRGLWVATIFGGKDWVRGRFSGWHVESFSALCGGCFSIINLTFAWHFLSDSAILFASLSLSLAATTFISFRYGSGSATQSRSQTYSVSSTPTHTHTHKVLLLLRLQLRWLPIGLCRVSELLICVIPKYFYGIFMLFIDLQWVW